MNGSVGARLKQAREQRHLTLQQASEATKVRTHYLQALENDDLSAMSSTAQARGFLRIYAEFLGLNVAELTASLGSLEAGTVQEVQPVIPVAAPAPTPATAQAAPSKTTRPGLLATLRDRLTRRANVKGDDARPGAIAPQAPVLDKEPLPAEQIMAETVGVQVADAAGRPSEGEEQSAHDSAGKNGQFRNSKTKPQGSPADVVEQKTVVKKNASV